MNRPEAPFTCPLCSRPVTRDGFGPDSWELWGGVPWHRACVTKTLVAVEEREVPA